MSTLSGNQLERKRSPSEVASRWAYKDCERRAARLIGHPRDKDTGSIGTWLGLGNILPGVPIFVVVVVVIVIVF